MATANFSQLVTLVEEAAPVIIALGSIVIAAVVLQAYKAFGDGITGIFRSIGNLLRFK